MKTLEKVLKECPKHDTVIVVYENERKRVKESQLRYLQQCVARKELDHEKIKVISQGETYCFRDDGIILGPIKGNIMTLTDNLALGLMLIR